MSDDDERIRRHFQGETLPGPRLLQLLAARREVVAKAAARTRRELTAAPRSSLLERLSSWLGLSRGARLAQCAVLLIVIGLTATFMHRSGSILERSERTMREVAMNHVTRLELEYRAASLDELDKEMALLPFALSMPDRLQANARPVGSRYCSLAGHLAAHVKFTNAESGRPLSLFVTSSSGDLADLAGMRTEVAGVDVELWQEGGLFYAMATYPDDVSDQRRAR